MDLNSAAIACLGGMYEKLGRMVGRSYEETISLLVKALKNAEVADLLTCKTWLISGFKDDVIRAVVDFPVTFVSGKLRGNLCIADFGLNLVPAKGW